MAYTYVYIHIKYICAHIYNTSYLTLFILILNTDDTEYTTFLNKIILFIVAFMMDLKSCEFSINLCFTIDYRP